MCGIIGYTGNENPVSFLIKGLKQLEYRGYDSAGIAVFSDNGTHIVRAVGPVRNLEHKVSKLSLQGFSGIGHTRWATHGKVTEGNSHPHQAGRITLVHNGIIENYSELKEQIEQIGRTLKSETDTEVLAHLIDIEVEKGFLLLEAITRVIPKLRGSYAFVVSDPEDPRCLIGVSQGIPLWVGNSNGNMLLSSDSRGLSLFTNEGFVLKSAEIVQCRPGSFQVFDFSGHLTTKNISLTQLSNDSSELVGFEHYMMKEIYEQPLAVLNTKAKLIQSAQLYSLPFKLWDHVQLMGCGSARHAGLVAKHYFEQIVGVTATVDYASEFSDCFNHTQPSTLVILISQSGETADTLSALRAAKNRGLATLSITNRKQSSLSLESDFCLFTEAGCEISVASTKAFTSQVSLLLALAYEWSYQIERVESSFRPQLNPYLSALPEQIAQTLQRDKQIRFIAEKLLSSRSFFFLGRGVLFNVAQECALKLKEISYCFAEAYPAGELKHGPLALIDKDSTVILLTTRGSTGDSVSDPLTHLQQDKMKNTLQEVKSRGAFIWTWGADTPYFRQESHEFPPLPSSHRFTEPILHTVLGQLFAYHLAHLKGAEIDKPRNLAKSVTVE